MAKRRSAALVKAEKQLVNARRRARNLTKKYNKPPVQKMAVQIGGGALSGAIQVYSPISSIGGIDIDGIAGIAFVGLGSFSKGQTAEIALDLGTGMLAAVASRYTENFLK